LSISPGTYTFTGSGGKDIESFKVGIEVQTPFTLTNKGSLASITRSQGTTLTWSGGFASGDVTVNGVVARTNASGSISFYCHAPSSAGQLTIPSSTLLALPPGDGKLMVINATPPRAFRPQVSIWAWRPASCPLTCRRLSSEPTSSPIKRVDDIVPIMLHISQ